MLTLLVLQGPDRGRRYELPDAVTLIGRESRQMLITDDTVSRRHCELVPQDNRWILKDLGSVNGTYLNGSRVAGQSDLKLGDQIRVGRTLMVFGAQPGVSRSAGSSVALAGKEVGMDSSIMHTLPTSDDSMVLAVPEPAAVAMSNLKILYQLGATLGGSISIDQLVEVVMDLVFENVKADRGLILLLDSASGELIPAVVRSRDRDTGGPEGPNNEEKIHASRTIVNHVLMTGEGVLSSNAMTDQRFSKGKSVHDLGIRSAMCVPIKAPKFAERQEAIVGVIYIDSSVRNYTYSPEQLRLLNAIGVQAGMAIQNFKLYQAQLKAERMAAVGETTAALSHSIKNILQALRGGADVVEMGLKASNMNQTGKGWRIVSRNLDRIYNLTLNLLAYSKEREPRLQLVNINSVANDCLELLAPLANEKHVMAVADLDQDHPPIPLDPDGMHQVLMNLLGNALDAVEPQKGLIRLVTRFDAKNSQSVVEVVDNGTGIDKNVLPHIFELFHSTKGNRGTGLGLSVARKIVEEHEGTINVASKPGEGSTFEVRLPVRPVNLESSDTHLPQ